MNYLLGSLSKITKLAGFEYTKYISGNFCKQGVPLIQGKNIKNNKLCLDGVKYISEELSNFLSRSKIQKNDILFCYVANVGDCWLNENNLNLHLGSNIARISVNKRVALPKYVYYWFQSSETYNFINQIAKGSVQKNINMEELRNLELNIPNLAVQQHIVDTIGSIDDLIEHNNLLIDKLNNFIWLKFLKLKEAINKNVVDNLIMKDLVNITTGKKNANAAVDNGQYAFFTCSLDDYKTDNYCFDCEAIIIAGNGAINVKYYKGKFDAYQRTYVITSNKYFFYCYCLYKDSINSLIAGSKGSVINFITLGMLQEINVKITNESIHKLFETECSILMNNICKLKDKNNQLEQLKKQYLNKFFG